MWTIGFADRLRFPRFPRKLGKPEMLAFTHITTGAAASKGLDIDEVKSTTVGSAVAAIAIGADTETGRATP